MAVDGHRWGDMFILVVGYSMGYCFGAIFIREAGLQLGVGLSVGSELIGKGVTGRTLIPDVRNTLKKSKIISNIYKVNIVNSIDFMTILLVAISSLMLFLSVSQEITKIKEHHAFFYMPLYILGVLMMGSIVVALIGGLGGDENTPTAAFIA